MVERSTSARRGPSALDEGHPHRWTILAVLCAALCVVVLDNTILSVAIPSVGAALRADETELQWITAAYGLVLAALLLPLAGLGDRFGRKGLLLVGAALFGVASAAAAFATTSGQLTVGRGLMGIGGAATMPATLAVLGNVFAAHERGRAIAIWSGASSIAGATGPVVGGLLLEHFWWGSVFLVNVPVTLAVFVAAVRFVPTSRDPAAPRIDVTGSLIWTGALGLLLYAVIEGGEQGWTSPTVVAAGTTSATLLLSFAWWERRTPHPLLAPSAVADRRMQAGMVVVPAVFFAVFGLQFVFTQWLQGVQGLGPLATGLCFAPHAAAVFGGSLLSIRLARRMGAGRTAAAGLLVLAVALTAGALLHGGVLAVAAAITLAGLGVGLATPPGVDLIMGSVPPERAGSAAGVNETIIEAGGALGIAVTGTLLATAAGGVGSIAPELLGGPGGVAARQQFTDALTLPLLVAAGVMVVAAVVVRWRTTGTPADGPTPTDGDAVGVSGAGVVVAESTAPVDAGDGRGA